MHRKIGKKRLWQGTHWVPVSPSPLRGTQPDRPHRGCKQKIPDSGPTYGRFDNGWLTLPPPPAFGAEPTKSLLTVVPMGASTGLKHPLAHSWHAVTFAARKKCVYQLQMSSFLSGRGYKGHSGKGKGGNNVLRGGVTRTVHSRVTCKERESLPSSWLVKNISRTRIC